MYKTFFDKHVDTIRSLAESTPGWKLWRFERPHFETTSEFFGLVFIPDGIDLREYLRVHDELHAAISTIALPHVYFRQPLHEKKRGAKPDTIILFPEFPILRNDLLHIDLDKHLPSGFRSLTCRRMSARGFHANVKRFLQTYLDNYNKALEILQPSIDLAEQIQDIKAYLRKELQQDDDRFPEYVLFDAPTPADTNIPLNLQFHASDDNRLQATIYSFHLSPEMFNAINVPLVKAINQYKASESARSIVIEYRNPNESIDIKSIPRQWIVRVYLGVYAIFQNIVATAKTSAQSTYQEQVR